MVHSGLKVAHILFQSLLSPNNGLRVDSLLKQMQSIELNKLGRKSGRCCVGKARGAKVKMSAQLTLAHFDLNNTSPAEFANVARGCDSG